LKEKQMMLEQLDHKKKKGSTKNKTKNNNIQSKAQKRNKYNDGTI
jgi:hypothetical protein